MLNMIARYAVEVELMRQKWSFWSGGVVGRGVNEGTGNLHSA
ncbi:hypothetical protein BOO71_0004309 [Deinococcus marmoris]|uniref:Uncharacterized protein n=1 Tax=Deinococcus marmoris TaxID=249408 RepID=A0A1U7P180_9DEIO|nr:hypothetical protein BOO71_0004309 [Deinococcus marmoris]